jgi:hypothetical protein
MTFFHLYADRKEKRRQRQRLYYAQNREEILKRQRQSYEQKRKATALMNGVGSVSHTPATERSAVTKIQKLTGASCVAPEK